MRLWFATALVCLVSSESAVARIYHVPAQMPTIQSAINSSSAGDTVLVADGLYYEHLNYYGKPVTVASNFILDRDTSHISATVVDGSRPGKGDTGSVVIFCSNESPAAHLRGLTLRSGDGTPVEVSAWGELYAGSAILITNGSPTVSDCRLGETDDLFAVKGSPRIRRCDLPGTLMAFDYASVSVDSCTVNTTNSMYGGHIAADHSELVRGIYMEYGSFALSSCSSTGEIYVYRGSGAAAQSTAGSATISMDGSLDLSHTVVTGDVMHGGYDGRLALVNVTVVGSVHAQTSPGGTITITRSVVAGSVLCDVAAVSASCSVCKTLAVTADIVDTNAVYLTEPQFCNASAGDFHPSQESQSAPDNNACAQLIGALEVGCSCCTGSRGNLAGAQSVDLYDLSILIAYLTVVPTPTLSCPSAANVNATGAIDLGDLAYLIAYFTGHSSARTLPSCSADIARL